MVKLVVVTGGVLSGLGKGVLSASIGKILSSSFKCAAVKCDGYLNVDPGTMNPVEHGEVFVLDDGTECDMDFGHYERFMGVTAKGSWNLTMGKVFKSILERERRGDYLGKTVQFVPHVTEEIKKNILEVGKDAGADIVLVEIGGTVGDMENALYLEAVRELAQDLGRENVLFVHLSYVPIPYGVHEQKSKPTQLSVRELNKMGIWPSIIACRCSEHLTEKIKKKISLFCNVNDKNVFTAIDVPSVYLLPGELESQGMTKVLEEWACKKLCKVKSVGSKWNELAEKMVELKNNGHEKKLKIGICGKYTALGDSYASVVEALHHSSANLGVHVGIDFVDTEKIEEGVSVKETLEGFDGIIVPGGFGNRGWEGKIKVIEYARKNNLPFLGICLGLQAAVIEFARNECGLADANSTEMNPKVINKVITLMDEQRNVVDLGGTMRLGSYEAALEKGSIIASLYNSAKVFERHRHRYEVNPKYHSVLKEKGLSLSGLSPNGKLVEFIELKNHSYFVATQSHPELKSGLERPAPLFYGLVRAAKLKAGI
ncbi:MAG: CTP synthase (glutamine hydrolyzing) [Candidatus Diapherotrites archaeon]|nr:CTP synthase (glutamine hydrolyzing) [Candidatus Diapherotrites archaeon]